MLLKSGTDCPNYSFVLFSEALRCFPVIESAFPNFIRAIIYFRPWVPWIVLLFITKDSNGPENMFLCVLEVIHVTCRAVHIDGDSI